MNNIQDAKQYLKEQIKQPFPEIAIILGSGLGALGDQLENAEAVPTSDIPHWPTSTVQGHRGRFVVGTLNETPVIILQGRVHYYEGYSMEQVVFPVRVLGALGVRKLILTNASGGLHTGLKAGDLMAITDHINLMGTNPLIGPNRDELGTRFPDMSEPYNAGVRQVILETARDEKIAVKTGILIATTGPSYETAAEVRMMHQLGADSVCMSTVPEVIAANHMGMHIGAVSCITNLATGITGNKLDHSEVEAIADQTRHTFIQLMTALVPRLEKIKIE